MTDTMRRCSICAITSANGAKLLRFALVQTHVPREDGPGHTTRGAGGITLCAQCWDRYARPGMKKVRTRTKLEREREARRRLLQVGVPAEAVA